MPTINEAFAKAADASGHEHGSDGKFTSKGGKKYKLTEHTGTGTTHVHAENGKRIGYVRENEEYLPRTHRGQAHGGVKPGTEGQHAAFYDTGWKTGNPSIGGRPAGGSIPVHYAVGNGDFKSKEHALHALTAHHESLKGKKKA